MADWWDQYALAEPVQQGGNWWDAYETVAPAPDQSLDTNWYKAPEFEPPPAGTGFGDLKMAEITQPQRAAARQSYENPFSVGGYDAITSRPVGTYEQFEQQASQLAQQGRAERGAESFDWIPGSQTRAVALGVLEWGGDVTSLIQRATGLGDADATNRLLEDVETARKFADTNLGAWFPTLSNYVAGGVRSIGVAGTAAAFAPATGGSSFALVVGSQALIRANQAGTEATDAGLTGWDKIAYAATQGLIEGGITAAFGASGFEATFTKNLAKNGMKEFAKTFVKDTFKELPEELMISFADKFTQKLAGIDPESWSKSEAWEIVKDTVGQTVVTMGIAQGGKGAYDFSKQKLTPNPSEQSGQRAPLTAPQDLRPSLESFAEQLSPGELQELATAETVSRSYLAKLGFPAQTTVADRKHLADYAKLLVGDETVTEDGNQTTAEGWESVPNPDGINPDAPTVPVTPWQPAETEQRSGWDMVPNPDGVRTEAPMPAFPTAAEMPVQPTEPFTLDPTPEPPTPAPTGPQNVPTAPNELPGVGWEYGQPSLPGQKEMFDEAKPKADTPPTLPEPKNEGYAPAPQAPPVDTTAPDKKRGFKKHAEDVAKEFDIPQKDLEARMKDVYAMEKELHEWRAPLRQLLKDHPHYANFFQNNEGDETNLTGFDDVIDEFLNNNPGFVSKQNVIDLIRKGAVAKPTPWSENIARQAAEWIREDIEHGRHNPESDEPHPDSDVPFLKRTTPPPVPKRPPKVPGVQSLKETVLKRGIAAADAPIQLQQQAPSGKVEKPISGYEIVDAIAKEFGVPTHRGGRIRGKHTMGQYNTFFRAIGLKRGHEGDIRVQSHEAAHHLDQTSDVLKNAPDNVKAEVSKLDYDPKAQRDFEGFAEYVRVRLTGPKDSAQTEAPQFTKYFDEWLEKHPDWKAKFTKVRALYDRYDTQGAKARLTAQMQPQRFTWEGIKDLVDTQISRFQRAWVSGGEHDFGRLTKAAKKMGAKFEPGTSPVTTFRSLNMSGPALAKHGLEHGIFSMGPDGPTRLGPGLKEVLADIDATELNNFNLFLYARHALETHMKGVNPGVTLQDAQTVFDELNSERYEAAAKRYKAMMDAGVDMVAEIGMISKSSAEAIKEFWETYIPLTRRRPFSTRELASGKGMGMVDKGAVFKRRVGSELHIINPLESAVRRITFLYERAAQFVVVKSAIDTAEKHSGGVEGLGEFITPEEPGLTKTDVGLSEVWPSIRRTLEEMGFDVSMFGESIFEPEGKPKKPPAHLTKEEKKAWREARQDEKEARAALNQLVNMRMAQDLVSIFRPDFWHKGDLPVVRIIRGDGQPKMYRLDQDFYRSVKSMDVQRLPWFFDLTIGAAARGLRLGATGLRPAFALMNLARDTQTALAQSPHLKVWDAWRIPAEMGRYVKNVVQEFRGKGSDPLIVLYRQYSGEANTAAGIDQRHIELNINKMMRRTAKAKALGMLTSPTEWTDALRTAIGVAEAGPRMAVFERALASKGWTRERIRKDGSPPRAVIFEGVEAARDSTVDFTRAGYYGRTLNQVTAFFNAPVQGMDMMRRTFRDNPKRAFLAVAAYVAADLAYWADAHDKDWYKDAPWWLKFGFGVFDDGDGNPIIRIPYTQEWGKIFGGLTLAVMDQLFNDQPEAVKKWMENVYDTTLPPIVPTFAKPIIEVLKNENFTGVPIVPEHELKGLKKEDQYTPETTYFARKMGEITHQSPAQIEHLLNGYTGNLFRDVAKASERMLYGGDYTIPDILTSGMTIKRDYSQAVQDFYGRLDELKREKGSADLKGKPLSAKDAQDLYRFDKYAEMITQMKKGIPANATRAERSEIERYIRGLAIHAMGREELQSYPNPLGAENPPTVVREVAQKFAIQQMFIASDPRPERKKGEPLADYTARVEEQQAEAERSKTFLKEMTSIDQADANQLMLQGAKKRGLLPNSTAIQHRRGRLRGIFAQ